MAGQHTRSARIPADITPLVVLQAINITWTKWSRGAPRAALRHAVPDAVLVPPAGNPLPEPALLYHKVQYGERNDFRMPVTDTSSLQPFNSPLYQHNVAVSRVDDDVRVDLNWEQGAPVRRFTHQIMTLSLNNWGRVRFNYRTSHEDFWQYDLWILNIGWFSSLTPNIFETTIPVKTFSSMAEL